MPSSISNSENPGSDQAQSEDSAAGSPAPARATDPIGSQDVIAAPAWRPHNHAASKDSVLFRVTDAPVLSTLGLLRNA